MACSGMTTVVATHSMNFARDLAHRVCFLEDGRTIEEPSREGLFTNTKEGRTPLPPAQRRSWPALTRQASDPRRIPGGSEGGPGWPRPQPWI